MHAQTACPTLSLGSAGPSVIALQQFFVSASNFPQADVTGHFGPITQSAVEEWQSNHGIVSSGTPASTGYGAVGPKTAAAMKLCTVTTTSTSSSPTNTASATFTRTLALGASGSDVLLLQQFLISEGFLPAGDATGYFGALTQAGVQKFQTQNGIVSSGSPQTTGYGAVGLRTRMAIAQLMATPPSSTTNTANTQTASSPTTPPPAPPPALAACTFNNQSIASGSSVTAYQSATVPAGQTCTSETRTCNDGTLYGDPSYQYSSCTVSGAASCTFNNQTIQDGATVTAYQSSSVAYGGQCTSETRTCQNGSLSGSYQYSSCTAHPTPLLYVGVVTGDMD